MRLAFMGTPGFAVPCLEALLATGHDVARVYTQPPKPAGRGRQHRAGEVHRHAVARGLAVATPASLEDAAEAAAFSALGLDAAVVVAYGLLLPKPFLEAPRLGCVNVHASLLPRWRGAAPIQRAILAGDALTGITIMRMDEGLDTGPIVLAEPTAIGPDETAAMLHDRLAAMGADLIVRALDGLAAGALTPRAQPAEGASYAPRLRREEGRLDWSRAAATLARQVRALTPWPGAFFEHAGERIKVLAAVEAEGRPGAAPGTVLDEALRVACADGALRLLEVQRAGRVAMPAEAFLRGFDVRAGVVLGA